MALPLNQDSQFKAVQKGMKHNKLNKVAVAVKLKIGCPVLIWKYFFSRH